MELIMLGMNITITISYVGFLIVYLMAHGVKIFQIVSKESYGLNMQMFGIMISELCRDANSIETPYRLTDMKKGYQQISVKNVPKTISPFVAITRENFDESLMASIILSDKPDEEIKSSPLERL